MGILEITLLGGFQARFADGSAVELPGGKDRALLAYLALTPGVAQPRDKLADLLWGSSGDRLARDSLKQAVLRLRRSLEPAALPPLVADRQSVMLAGDRVAVDVVTFEALLKDGTITSVERAVTLYRGDLLDGMRIREPAFEDWLLIERERLRQAAVGATARLASDAFAAGLRERAAMAARRLLSLDPLHEGACRILMRIHADRAERAQALKLFQTIQGRLRQELGIGPEPETCRLYQAIRQHRRPADGDHGGGEDLSGRPGAAVMPAVAVLPFANIGGEPEQEYFADGLTEDIITELSQIPSLSVAARHTAFAFKGRTMPVQEVARNLNVSHVLEGSVRKSGNRVRITAQLVDATTGRHLWAQRYDRPITDIFALQDEISRSLVRVLQVRLSPAMSESAVEPATVDADAYQFYLMGRSLYLRGFDRRCLGIARAMFAKAVDIDPCYARALTGMAICDSHLSLSNRNGACGRTLDHVSRALALAPDLADAHAAEGLAHYVEGRYAVASAAFDRAITLDPNLFEAHFFQARCRHLQGRRDQAAVLFAHAAELRPDDFRSVGLLAEEHKALGNADAFEAAARRCVERAAAEVRYHPENADAWAFGSTVLAELGDASRAAEWATRAAVIGPDDHLVNYNLARTYTVLGHVETAMDWLERAFRSSPAFQRRLAAWMPLDQEIDGLRDHRRFRRFERAHLA